jgi:hypothetical protein
MDARQQAVLWDFVVWAAAGFLVGAAPIIQAALAAPPSQFDARLFLWALLGAFFAGVLGALRKLLAPQIVGLNVPATGAPPTVTSVTLKDVKPADSPTTLTGPVIVQTPPPASTLVTNIPPKP